MNKYKNNNHYILGDKMKKIIFIVFIVIMILTLNNKIEANRIPEEAIRLRVIANSNSGEDQKIKLEVRDKVQKKLYNLLKEVKGIENARKIINDNLDDINETVKETINSDEYNINFGLNYFPEKKYKGVIYNEGYYESLVITLGNGEGNNWWCVLFPPFCLIEAEESNDVEYKFFIQELLEKYL